MCNNNESIKKDIKEDEGGQRRNKLIKIYVNFLLAIIMIIYAITFTICSFSNFSSKFGFFLAILSLVLTISYEVYEWTISILSLLVHKINKIQKLYCELNDYPFIASLPVIIASIVITIYLNISNKVNYNKANLVCSITICIYMISMLIRKIFLYINEKN